MWSWWKSQNSHFRSSSVLWVNIPWFQYFMKWVRFGDYQSSLSGHWCLCIIWLHVSSPACNGYIRFTSGATPAELWRSAWQPSIFYPCSCKLAFCRKLFLTCMFVILKVNNDWETIFTKATGVPHQCTMEGLIFLPQTFPVMFRA